MTTSVGMYTEKSSYINSLMNMTVPELQNELDYKIHTIVEQMIIMDLIRRKRTQQFECQADKNFVVKFRSYPQSCIRGVPLTEPKGADKSKYCLQAQPDTCPMNVVSASVNPNNTIPENPTNPNAKNVIIKDNYNPPYFTLNDFSNMRSSAIPPPYMTQAPCVASACIQDPSASKKYMHNTTNNSFPYMAFEDTSSCTPEKNKNENVNSQLNLRFMDDIVNIKKIHGLA